MESFREVPQVTLEIDDPFINLCGVQPLLSEGGFVKYSHIIFTHRLITPHNNGNFCHTQKLLYRRRLEAENDIIMKNILTKKEASWEIVQKMLNYGKHYSFNKSLKQISSQKMGRLLKFRREYLRVTTGGVMGNFVIMPEEDFDKRNLSVQDDGVIFANFGQLERNTMIIGSSARSVFGNPIVACPIIPKEKLMEFCIDNAFDTDTIVFDGKRRYPFINKMLDWYEIYQLYLQYVGTNEWYLEDFSESEAIHDFYNIIHFQEH